MPAGPDVKNIRFSIDDAMFCFNAKYVFSSSDVILPHEFMRNTRISFYKKVVYKKVGLQRTKKIRKERAKLKKIPTQKIHKFWKKKCADYTFDEQILPEG